MKSVQKGKKKDGSFRTWRVLYFDYGMMKELLVTAMNIEEVTGICEDEGVPNSAIYAINLIPVMSKEVNNG